MLRIIPKGTPESELAGKNVYKGLTDEDRDICNKALLAMKKAPPDQQDTVFILEVLKGYRALEIAQKKAQAQKANQ